MTIKISEYAEAFDAEYERLGSPARATLFRIEATRGYVEFWAESKENYKRHGVLIMNLTTPEEVGRNAARAMFEWMEYNHERLT